MHPCSLSLPPARGPALELALEAARSAIFTCGARQQKVIVGVVDSAGVLKIHPDSPSLRASASGVMAGRAAAGCLALATFGAGALIFIGSVHETEKIVR